MGVLLGWRPLPKLGGCSRCARPAGTLAAEKNVLAGGAGQNMILSFSAGCGRRNSARRALPGESVGRKGRWGPLGLFCGLPPGPAALPGESVGRKGMGYPTGDFPPPKPSPRGEGAPVRTLGRMRGRSCTPPFLVEKGALPTVASTRFFYCFVGHVGRPLISHLRCQLPPKGKPLGCGALHEKAFQIRVCTWVP